MRGGRCAALMNTVFCILMLVVQQLREVVVCMTSRSFVVQYWQNRCLRLAAKTCFCGRDIRRSSLPASHLPKRKYSKAVSCRQCGASTQFQIMLRDICCALVRSCLTIRGKFLWEDRFLATLSSHACMCIARKGWVVDVVDQVFPVLGFMARWPESWIHHLPGLVLPKSGP